MVYLAVYGTLKRGNHNHEVHLAKDPVRAKFFDLKSQMYSNGRFPMLVKCEEYNPVFIEIYEITEEKLEEIDKLEEPFGYHRELIVIEGIESWIYYYTSNNPPEEFSHVEDGNFEKEREW